MSGSPTIHASAVLVGRGAVLVRGPSGSGKSWLALRLLQAAQTGMPRFARLVGDDRVTIEAAGGALLVRPAETLAGLLEVRGLGILRFPHEPLAIVCCVLDLDAAGAPRLPAPSDLTVTVQGVTVPRLAPGPKADPLEFLLAWITSGKMVLDHDVSVAKTSLRGAPRD